MRLLFLQILLFFSSAVFAQNILPVKKNNLWGFIDRTGFLVIPCEYDFVSEPNTDSLILASRKGVLTLLDTRGNRKTPEGAEEIKLIGNKLFLVKMKGKWGVSNFNQDFLIPPIYKQLSTVSSSLLSAQDSSGLFGCVDMKNKVIISFNYERLRVNLNGLLEAKKKDDTEFYNDKGVFLYSLNDKHSKLIEDKYLLVQEGKFWGLKNLSGNNVVPFEWEEAYMLTTGLIRFSKFKRAMLFSVYSGTILALDLNKFALVRENLYLYENDTLKGLVDIDGKAITPCEFKEFKFYGDIINCVYPDKMWVLYTVKGVRVVPGRYDDIIIYDKISVVVAQKDNKFGVWNLNGKELCDFNADTVSVYDSIVKIYTGDNFKKVVVDRFGNVLREESFKNVARIKVRKNLTYSGADTGVRLSVGVSAANTSVPQNNITINSDTLYNGNWFYVKKRKQWGLKNNVGKVVLFPEFTKIEVNDSLGYTVVFSNYWMPNKYNTGGISFAPEVTIGIYDHIHFRYILPCDFTSLRYVDFKHGEFARCIPNFENAQMTFVNLKGKTIKNNFSYIGHYRNSLARVLVDATLSVSAETNHLTFMSANEFITDLHDSYKMIGAKGFIQNNYGKWGYVNHDAQFVIAPFYDYAEDFKSNVAIVGLNKRYGLIDNLGNTLISLEYDGVKRLPKGNDSLFLVSFINEKWGVLNENGKVETFALYDDISLTANSNYYIYKRGKWKGILNAQFQQLFEDTCKKIEFIDSSFFLISFDSTKYYFNAADKNMSILEGDEIKVVQYCLVIKNDKLYHIYDAMRNEVSTSVFPVKRMIDGGFVFYSKTKYGGELLGVKLYSSNKEQEVLYDRIGAFSKGKAYFYKKGYYGILSIEGKEIVKAQYDEIMNQEKGVRLYRKLALYGVMSESGQIIIPAKYNQVVVQENGLFIVQKKNKFNIINTKGDSLLPVWYSEIKDFNEGLAIVSDSNDYFLMNEQGVIQTKAFKNLQYLKDRLYLTFNEEGISILNERGESISFHAGLTAFSMNQQSAIYSSENKKGLLNMYGAKVVEAKYEELKYLGNGMYKYKLKEFYKMFDIKGNEVISFPSERIKLIQGNIYMVEAGNRIGYLKQNGEWLWPLTF